MEDGKRSSPPQHVDLSQVFWQTTRASSTWALTLSRIQPSRNNFKSDPPRCNRFFLSFLTKNPPKLQVLRSNFTYPFSPLTYQPCDTLSNFQSLSPQRFSTKLFPPKKLIVVNPGELRSNRHSKRRDLIRQVPRDRNMAQKVSRGKHMKHSGTSILQDKRASDATNRITKKHTFARPSKLPLEDTRKPCILESRAAKKSWPGMEILSQTRLRVTLTAATMPSCMYN